MFHGCFTRGNGRGFLLVRGNRGIRRGPGLPLAVRFLGRVGGGRALTLSAVLGSAAILGVVGGRGLVVGGRGRIVGALRLGGCASGLGVSRDLRTFGHVASGFGSGDSGVDFVGVDKLGG